MTRRARFSRNRRREGKCRAPLCRITSFSASSPRRSSPRVRSGGVEDAAGGEGLASEFLESIQPFRFPPLISQNILRETAAVKERIEKEVVGGEELERNVKLGRGGIREIEFLVQSLQVLHAG